jgi:hypothetical protein
MNITREFVTAFDKFGLDKKKKKNKEKKKELLKIENESSNQQP